MRLNFLCLHIENSLIWLICPYFPLYSLVRRYLPYTTVVALLLTALPTLAQEQDSTSIPLAAIDSAQTMEIRLDSIEQITSDKLTSFKNEYDSIDNLANLVTGSIQRRIDSLTTIHLPTTGLTAKLDSINQWKADKLQAVREKTDALKSKTIGKINDLDIPPELKSKAQELTSKISNYDISLPGSKLNLAGLHLNANLPQINAAAAGLPNANLPRVNTDVVPGEVKDVSGEVSAVENSIPKDQQAVSTLAENKTAEASGMDNLGLPKQQANPFDQDAAKQNLKSQAPNLAVNHFKGREEVLKSAMNKLSKYKSKYTTVSSIKDLPKHPPNPMKDKPFVERFIPGMTLQLHRNNDWLLDFNPHVAWRFSGRITAGVGWEHRWAYNSDEEDFNKLARIYGPRAFGEFRLSKGIAPMLSIEYLNVPVHLRQAGAPIGDGRQWLWGAMAGIKKEYKITRFLRGNVQLLYNIYSPYFRSPYETRLNMRLGFEVMMRKKPAQPKEEDKNAPAK